MPRILYTSCTLIDLYFLVFPESRLTNLSVKSLFFEAKVCAKIHLKLLLLFSYFYIYIISEFIV